MIAETPFDCGRPIPEAAWSVRCDWIHPHVPRPDHDKPEIVVPPFHGAPFGGFGAGTFARTYRGDFARWHLHTGYHHYRSLPACAQAIAVHGDQACEDAFVVGPTPADGTLSAWKFRTRGFRYHALYPQSWMEGTAAGDQVRWRLTQFSPVLPENYRDTSLPVAVFRWHLYNDSDRPLRGTVATTWENLSITSPGDAPAHRSVHLAAEAEIAALWLGRIGVEPLSEEEGSFVIAGTGGVPFFVPLFDAAGRGTEFWEKLLRAGDDTPATSRPRSGRPIAQGTGRCAAGLGLTVDMPPGSTREVAFALAWHFPVFRFGSGRRWYRRYTRFATRGIGRGDAGDPTLQMAHDALRSRQLWQETIEDWQAPILAARSPELARALFNSLYILADGGTAWENGEVLAPEEDAPEPAPPIPGAHDIGRFSILECFTYPYYATLDVRYYGSLPILFFWPQIERQVLLQFAAAAGSSDHEEREMKHVRELASRKRAGALPHDLGSPNEDPWVRTNAYDDIDPNRWKDLGPKFVLLVARYMARVGWEDRGFLRGVWPAVKGAMALLAEQDRDRDGLPENEGIPDQTFDKWPMKGASAYCSLLAIASLGAASELAGWCGDPGAAAVFESWRAKAVFSMRAKLWAGIRLRYDEVRENRDLVMAGQLSGDWSAALAHLPLALPPEDARRALGAIWRSCAVRVKGRLWGLRNGAVKEGEGGPTNRHAREIWTGINYAIASHMILVGMRAEADELVTALSRIIFQDCPYAFATPEAWDDQGDYRGPFYMRPLAVWAVEEALRRTEPVPGLPSFFSTESTE